MSYRKLRYKCLGTWLKAKAAPATVKQLKYYFAKPGYQTTG